MLLSKHTIGNARLYDLKTQINTNFIRTDFNKITYPYRNTSRFKYVNTHKIIQMPNNLNYPDFKMLSGSGSEEMVYFAMLFFIEQHKLQENTEISLEAFHMNPYSYNDTEWFTDTSTKKAILCVQKEGIIASMFELSDKNLLNINKNNIDGFKWDIFPGEMIIFESDKVKQRYSKNEFENEDGFQDLLIIKTV
jgi:hypothetical protein